MRSRHSYAYFLIIPIALTLSLGGNAAYGQARAPKAAPAARAKSPVDLTTAVRVVATSGLLEDLRWPDFSDYRALVDNFYKATGYATAWVHGGAPTRQAKTVVEVLQEADNEGLRAEDYDGGRWADRFARLAATHTVADEARFEVSLTVCVMRYISDLRIGRVNPRHFKFGLDVGPKKLNLPQFVRERLVAGSDVKAELAKIEPPFAGYKRTRTALLHYMELAREDDGTSLPVPEGSVAPGGRYEGLAQLARLLRKLGDLRADDVVPEDTKYYQQPLLKAVEHFQARHGMYPLGFLNPETFAQLNTPMSERVEQIRLMLERWRWIPYQFSEPPIVVNIPEFKLRAFDGQGKVDLSMSVNVGEAYAHETPVFEQNMLYLVFRPYWDVPPAIQRTEMVPAVEKDPNYYAENGFEVLTTGGQVMTGKITGEEVAQLRAGKLRLRQKPGPDNAMGLVKFIFPNEHNVYLHDTEAGLDLFSQTKRDLSHGCVHVEQPAELAAWVLRGNPEWTLKRVESAMHEGRDNVRVNLAKPIPVLILYGTAVVEEDGEVHFFKDIYGYDEKLEEVLAQGYPYP